MFLLYVIHPSEELDCCFRYCRQLLYSRSERRSVRLRGRQSGIGEGVGGAESRRQLSYRTHQGLLQGRYPRSARGDARGEAVQHLLQLPGAHPRLPHPQELHQAVRSEVRRERSSFCQTLTQRRSSRL